MALLRRELCRQIEGPEVTHADCRTLVFGTDAKTLYVEREVAHVDDVHDGMRMDGFRSAPTGSGSGSSAWFRLRVSYFGSTPDSRRGRRSIWAAADSA